MLRILLTVAFNLTLICRAFAAQDQNAPPTLEEINADLKAKKEELEPFDPKDVKIDIESLGLDDVDKKSDQKKPNETKTAEQKPEEKKPEGEKVEEIKPLEQKAEDVAKSNEKSVEKKAEEIKTEVKPEENKAEEVVKKIEEKVEDKKPQALPATSAADIKKPTKDYINSKKKAALKKRLEAERKLHANQQKEKLKKLNELRKQYLEEASEIKAEDYNQSDEDFELSEKIIPQKKDLNPFIDENMPALPILNRYRSRDNVHIPIILTPRERIGILFTTISSDDVVAFNEAYYDIENPNARNAQGDTILTYSLLLKKHAVAASAIAKGADPNMPNKLGYTPLNIAIELLDFKALELLANNKVDLNYIDAFGRTPLMHAARVGFLPAVDLLVSHGVDVNVMDNDGFTALAIAYRHKKELIVQYLLKHGAETWIEKPYDPEKQSLIKELEHRWE